MNKPAQLSSYKKKHCSLRTSILAGLAAFALPATHALAQEQSTEDEAGALEEVVVTARYREATVQELGLSIRAFGEDEMNRLGIVDVSSLARFTPSLNIQERGPNRNEMNIRGVSNFLVTQDLVPSARPVGLYLDESPINTLGGSQFDLRLFDMSRVEVLRGPQGTLYGEGSSAGAVRYFTNNPSLEEFEGHVEAEAVMLDNGGADFNARAAVSIPLAKDTVGLRLVAGTFNYPGFIDVVDGQKDINDLEANMFRAVLLAKPSDELSMRVMVHYDDSELGSLGLYSGEPSQRIANLPLDDAKIDDTNLVANLDIDWDIGPGVFTSLTSYFDRERDRYGYDQIYSLVNSITTTIVLGTLDQTFLEDHITQDQWSQEFRYVSQLEGPLQFTAGAFYKDFTFESPAGDTCTDTNLVFGLPDRCTNVSLDLLGFETPDVGLSNEGEQLSAYAEAEFSFAEKFKLIGGLRWHTEDLRVVSPETAGFLGFQPIVYGAIDEEVSIDTVLPKVALEFSANDDVLLYGQYSTGTRNGNLNSPATLASMELFVPGSSAGFESYGEDSTETYEAGIKSRFADGRVTFNAAAWYTEYEDLQVLISTPPLGFAVILNASKAISQGVEFDLFANPTDNLTLFGGASYTNSELDTDLVTNLITGAITPKGTPLPFAPDWTWNGGGEYIWPLGSDNEVYLNGNFTYTGEMNNSLSAAPTQVGDFWLFGAGFGYRQDDWSADLLVSNLTDEAEPVAINNFNPFYTLNTGKPVPAGHTFNEQFMLSPRTIRLIFRYRF
jgi:iron complex outermembrane receptor protein